MHTREALLDLHERAHRSLKKLLAHCRHVPVEELNRELAGFGYPSVRLQLHHALGGEDYWIGVLQDRVVVEDNDSLYPTVESLEAYREQVFAATENYLRRTSTEALNTARLMMTWGNREQLLTPAHVVVRTITHLYHHQGQVVAMCRILGSPAAGLDYPIT